MVGFNLKTDSDIYAFASIIPGVQLSEALDYKGFPKLVGTVPVRYSGTDEFHNMTIGISSGIPISIYRPKELGVSIGVGYDDPFDQVTSDHADLGVAVLGEILQRDDVESGHFTLSQEHSFPFMSWDEQGATLHRYVKARPEAKSLKFPHSGPGFDHYRLWELVPPLLSELGVAYLIDDDPVYPNAIIRSFQPTGGNSWRKWFEALAARSGSTPYWWFWVDSMEQAEECRVWFDTAECSFGNRIATWSEAIDDRFVGGRVTVDRIEFLIDGERLPLYERSIQT